MTLDEELLKDVDKVIKKLHTSRSEFIRRAIYRLLNELNVRDLEKLHRKGYEKYPVKKDEFDVWENEQNWA
jgi:metal-responsive CopG/Arc/MetJ family transcriptional regulator